jgi:hypothetical protein
MEKWLRSVPKFETAEENHKSVVRISDAVTAIRTG